MEALWLKSHDLPHSQIAKLVGVCENTMNALDQPVYLVDGFPMPVCKITRSYGSHCFKGEKGAICGYTFAATNIDERDVLQDMTQELSRLLIGDKGYIRPV